MSESASAIKRIVVPLDLNRLSEGKLPTAEAQARAFNAEMILLHVISPTPPSNGSVTVGESQARTYLDAIAARLRAEGIQAHSLLSYGPVADTIVEQIIAQKADLVVIGSNVRRGFSRLLLGSVAEDVVARAPCPVLLVRPVVADAEKTMAMRSFSDDAARVGPVAPRHLGVRTVDVARIVGSVGRAQELNESFRVRSLKDERRYDRILKLMENGTSLPPPALYKLGYGYYVLDGNHRVAAARELGQLEIDADVTEFVPLSDAQGQRVFVERRAFENATGLTRIGAALPGSYPRLEDLIREFAEARGLDDLEYAAAVWEAEVYRPVATRIRRLRLRQRLPGQRTADIFVQIADCRDREQERLGQTLGWEEAISHFVADSCPKAKVERATTPVVG